LTIRSASSKFITGSLLLRFISQDMNRLFNRIYRVRSLEVVSICERGNFMNHIRFKTRILQLMYRPKTAQAGNSLFSVDALSFLDELDQKIEEEITPILDELF